MPSSSSTRSIPIAARVNRFSYAIRNIVAAAKVVEARGMRVRYLNIGDPVAFGFQTPAHLVEAAAKAMRDVFSGRWTFLPSEAILVGQLSLSLLQRFRRCPCFPHSLPSASMAAVRS